MQGAVQRAAGMRAVAARGLATTAASLEKGFLGSFFERKVEAQAAAHSDKFAKKERISEICTHNVRPDSVDKYLKTQDQFVHIWRYEGGYKAIDENMKFLQDNKDYNLIMKDMSPLLRSRESE